MKKTIIALVLLTSIALTSCESADNYNIIHSPNSSTGAMKKACIANYGESSMNVVPAKCFKYVIK